MRLSNNMFYQNSLNQLLRKQSDVLQAQNQVATGEKYSSASQAPSDYAQAMLLGDKIQINEQHQKNINMLSSRLNTQESVLQNINTTIQYAEELAVRAGNGALNEQDKKALASELKELQKTLYELMNTQTEDGKFLFSGYQDASQAYKFDSVGGEYVYQGDQGQHQITIANNVKINSSDNGFTSFEKVAARLNIADTDLGTGIAVIADQGAFDAFHQANYDDVTAANNSFTINVLPPAPGTTIEQYEIVDSTGTVLQSGDYSGEIIDFNGLNISLNEGETTASVTLEAPQKKNVLNTLGDLINTLEDGSLTNEQYHHNLADANVGLRNASEKVVYTQATLGARMNALERVQDSNSAREINNQAARSNLVEVDMAAAISELTQHETALQASQATFGRLAKLSLFDYIG
ncbi:flagellar hook-associated protein FlgL [Pseudoalteromonas sp. T1lg48]|uniref:flagellar hook-associated protein FlgL n=1 Tax=Pseudoalteromonas sp. T1lg48 TaxID=2077100 RepID=UPI000CF6917A|nr:flagellar hook-associated protein FlgL [Pseudoalteromonas sp. T1lg48]